ncbi:MAG: hypothetical protein GY783_15350 [Gammaproteobacteria bacterium]|nr:hypothetical protein [Gammaproteobacteria bacterium]
MRARVLLRFSGFILAWLAASASYVGPIPPEAVLYPVAGCAYVISELLEPEPTPPTEEELAEIQLTERRRFVDFCREAHEGDFEARATLGAYFRNGWEPVYKDYVESYMWYTLSRRPDYVPATDVRIDMSLKMSASEIAEAERRVATWRHDPSSCEGYLNETTHSRGEEPDSLKPLRP